MYIPAWLIPFVAVLLWATATATWNSNAKLENPSGKRNRKTTSSSAPLSSRITPILNSNAGDGVYPIPSADSLRILTGLG